jgi:heme ABC exporter ATP-binding subunit CcmA
METVVRFRAAVCLLGRFPALAGVDLDVSAGEIVLMQGPNGAGKTTVLRACAGLVPVVDGEAEVLGVDLVADRRRVRPLVGLLGHGGGLYDDLTVAENVRFWVQAGRSKVSDADAALARLGLDGRLAEVQVARLSAGQRRRTALAILLARRPRLWLLDEPHAALDQEGRDLVDSLMQDAVAAGATVLFASHELDRAVAVAHRTITIAGGTASAAEPAAQPQPEQAVTGA